MLFSALLGVAAWQVIARNVADSGLSWGDPFVRIAVLWVTVIGALVASRRDEHIRIDVLSQVLGERARGWVRRCGAWFTAIVSLTFAWSSAQFVYYEYVAGIVAFAAVPAWVCEAVMPVGFALIGLRYLVHGLRPR